MSKMKRELKKIKKGIIFLLVPVFLIGCFPKRDTTRDFQRLEFVELEPIEVPEYTRRELKNGMIVYLMEDRTLPLIHFKALIKTGSIWDPQDKAGLCDITFEVIRTGGGGQRTGNEIDMKLEKVGAQIEAGADRDMGWVCGFSLKDNFNEIFSVFGDILRNPLFDQAKIELAKIKIRGLIARRNDNIEELANREFRRLIYGRDNPYARIVEYKTIEKITRNDLVLFYNNFFHPNNIVLGLWGDFESEEMLKKVESIFGDWEPREIQFPEKPIIEQEPIASFNLVIRKEATQSAIRMGHLGIRRDHPDYFASIVLSKILGAGWHSRFGRRLRTEEGLAYEVWAWQTAEFDYPGLFIATAQTSLGRTIEAITLMKREIELIRQKEVSYEELKVGKESILNAAVFWFDTKDEIIERLMRYEYYGYPLDYIKRLIEGIKEVTKNDILRVARAHLKPDKLTILVVGNPEFFDKPLSSLGEVRLLDISIPQ